jgi:hypothetical protein
MHTALQELCAKLDEIAEYLISQNSTTTRYNESHAWHLPAIGGTQMARLPRQMAEAIRESGVEALTESEEADIGELVESLNSMLQHTLPSAISTPSPGIATFLSMMEYAQLVVTPIVAWVFVGTTRMPSALSRRLQKSERELANLDAGKLDLEQKIKQILAANDAAEALPTTMQELTATQSEIRSISSSASEYIGKISTAHSTAEKEKLELEQYAEEGKKLVEQISDAYSVTTTVGLAHSFNERARSLNGSLYIWVTGLAISLVTLMIVGYFRLNAMKEMLSSVDASGSKLWIQLIISAFSVGAPIWFAWISTKQISQRFRLAEDYAFKASVAKAYEGYRREAIRIDPQFQKSLFASALKRLDEPPLRLVEMSTHGSPLHELANSSLTSRILDKARGRSGTTQPDPNKQGAAKRDGAEQADPS